jgi:hypothetical protein
VVAPVSDPFRAPATPYGPGNRGIEYDTHPGDEVRASADGEVVFAGLVAGTLHVTLLHADGVRTSYSFLDQIEVHLGQRVHQGDRIGVAGDRFHFGARLGDAYFDPATLFGTTTIKVELLPFEVPPGSTPQSERLALVEMLRQAHGSLALPSVGDVTGWLVDRAALARHYAVATNPARQGLALAWDITRRLSFPPECSHGPAPERPAARRHRVAVLVGGLGSSSASASIDQLHTAELGYDEADVVRFSYAGGRTPGTGTGGRFGDLQARPYTSADTQGDLRTSARRLADAIETVARDHPDALVDVYAHSMGGVVTRLALLDLEQRGVDLGRLGLVATMGAPHRGANLATAVAAANSSRVGGVGTDLVSEALDAGLDPHAPAAAQLAETSDVVHQLEADGVPKGVQLVSLAASGDLVVPSPATEVAGARNVTVGVTGRDAHGELVGTNQTTDELARALGGEPPRCESPQGVVAEEVMGHGIAYTEDLGGAALLDLGP